MVVEEEPLSARLARLGALLLALSPAATLGQEYEVAGGCRAGSANGAYELRMPDGRLRVSGAFAQGRVTGTFIFWTAGGARLAVLPFDNDARNGTVAQWYAAPDAAVEGGRKLAAPFVHDLRHGIERSWYPDGRLRGEYRYAQGVLAEARAWNEAGQPLGEAAARDQAGDDARADEALYASLRRLIAEHRPACD